MADSSEKKKGKSRNGDEMEDEPALEGYER